MSRLVNLRLFNGKLVAVNRFVPVRNASHGHDDHIQDPAFFGHFGPGVHPPVKLEPFNPFDPSHGLKFDMISILICLLFCEGVADLPDNFRGMPVQPNVGPNITMDYIPIPCKSYKVNLANCIDILNEWNNSGSYCGIGQEIQ